MGKGGGTLAQFAAHNITHNVEAVQGARGLSSHSQLPTAVRMKERTKQTRTKTHLDCATQIKILEIK